MAQALRAYFPLAEYHGRQTCDVQNRAQVEHVFQKMQPEMVIHCAALTAHNAEPIRYVKANVVGTVHVVEAALKHGTRLVYLSTDYLGSRQECDPVDPVNSYAASKYGGEIACGAHPGALVIRGSWYSRLDYDHAATDAFTSRLPVAQAAYFVACLATSNHTGTVNIGGQRRSHFEIALELNEQVTPCSRHDLDVGYEIPADSSLDTTKLNRLMAAM
jgi:dTDP-4-dehydrorhamnose reductase